MRGLSTQRQLVAHLERVPALSSLGRHSSLHDSPGNLKVPKLLARKFKGAWRKAQTRELANVVASGEVYYLVVLRVP